MKLWKRIKIIQEERKIKQLYKYSPLFYILYTLFIFKVIMVIYMVLLVFYGNLHWRQSYLRYKHNQTLNVGASPNWNLNHGSSLMGN